MVCDNDSNRNAFLGSDSLKISSDVNVQTFSTVKKLAALIFVRSFYNWSKSSE